MSKKKHKRKLMWIRSDINTQKDKDYELFSSKRLIRDKAAPNSFNAGEAKNKHKHIKPNRRPTSLR